LVDPTFLQESSLRAPVARKKLRENPRAETGIRKSTESTVGFSGNLLRPTGARFGTKARKLVVNSTEASRKPTLGLVRGDLHAVPCREASLP